MSDLKRRILDASVELVAERGVRGVSFREVARRAGASHQAPYHEFGNLRGIMRAIAEEGFSVLNEAMAAQSEAAGPDALDALTGSGIAYTRFALEHVGHFRVMFERSLVDLHQEEAPLVEAERAYETFVSLATRAAEAGYGRGSTPEQIVHLCWSTVHGLSILLVEGVLVAKRGETEAIDEARIAEDVVRSFARLLAND